MTPIISAGTLLHKTIGLHVHQNELATNRFTQQQFHCKTGNYATGDSVLESCE